MCDRQLILSILILYLYSTLYKGILSRRKGDSMIHEDHVNLLRKGILEPGGVWADLGSGAGAFTLALADLIGSTGEIYSVDKDAAVLRQQERAMRTRFP